ncbi:hypothetical protein [Phascolarctobacterium succinatutens]|uniref:hypothetical protein n=1 Tax=Phascolarctobacterium succinatutens TaxID=626940 RepID=UPI0026ED1B7B|nr:hypothetical protein [Phascolarctobacterium succinatutens]
MGKGLLVSSIALAAGFLLPVYADAAPVDTQQQIIAQKEQEQASKRAEQDLQHRVSQSMAKSQQQSSPVWRLLFYPRKRTVLELNVSCFMHQNMAINLLG